MKTRKRNLMGLLLGTVICLALGCGGTGSKLDGQSNAVDQNGDGILECGEDIVCPEGFACQATFCDLSNDPNAGVAYCPSICVPVNDDPVLCGEDRVCGPGEACVEECTEGRCFAFCQPVVNPIECRADAECGEGFHCEFLCKEGEVSNAGDCLGACVQDEQPPLQWCDENTACREGSHCELLCKDGVEGREGECFAICVSDEQPPREMCGVDIVCPEGFVCVADCLMDKNDDPNAGVPYCQNICVPGELPPEDPPKDICKANEDCQDGYFCSFLDCRDGTTEDCIGVCEFRI
jgi:hypothetical protein